MANLFSAVCNNVKMDHNNPTLIGIINENEIDRIRLLIEYKRT